MVNYISGLVFVVVLLIGGAIVAPFAGSHPMAAAVVGIAWFIADVVLASAIQLAAQWQRAVVFRLGKYKEIKGPGLFLIIPVIDQIRIVDTRILAVNIPKQQVITRDNVPVVIDGVLSFRVINAAEAIIMVQEDGHDSEQDGPDRRKRDQSNGPRHTGSVASGSIEAWGMENTRCRSTLRAARPAQGSALRPTWRSLWPTTVRSH